MALTIGDNFSYQGAKPLDGRIKYDTIAAMKAMADSTLYEGCIAYCTATDKNYQWKSSNTVDATLGKWRELESGIEYTAGDGIDITANEISTDRMESSEIDDLDIDTPGQPSGMYIDYTGTELAVGKLKLANGTVKTLYQKTVATGTISSGENTINTNITNGSNAYIVDGYLITSAGYALPLNSSVSSSAFAFSRVSTSGASIVITCSIGTVTSGYVTLRYTKTS